MLQQGGLPGAWGDGSLVTRQHGMNMGAQPFMWQLQKLACNKCSLTGSIPTQWQNWDSLQTLVLRNNSLRWAGPVGARRLTTLVLDHNPLAVPIPNTPIQLWPGRASALQKLSMSGTQLSGGLPYGECAQPWMEVRGSGGWLL